MSFSFRGRSSSRSDSQPPHRGDPGGPDSRHSDDECGHSASSATSSLRLRSSDRGRRPSLTNTSLENMQPLIEQFRTQLRSLRDPIVDQALEEQRLGSNMYLRKFLLARQLNLPKAGEMITTHFHWRVAKDCDRVLEQHMRGYDFFYRRYV